MFISNVIVPSLIMLLILILFHRIFSRCVFKLLCKHPDSVIDLMKEMGEENFNLEDRIVFMTIASNQLAELVIFVSVVIFTLLTLIFF